MGSIAMNDVSADPILYIHKEISEDLVCLSDAVSKGVNYGQ